MKQTIESDYKVYLERKRQGDDVIMRYEQIGYNLCPKLCSDFAIMHISINCIEIYQYHVNSDGAFSIEAPQTFEHHIGDILTNERMSDKKIQAWWNMVFLSQLDDIIRYDSYYDSLPIAERENMTFRELLSQLSQSLSKCNIPAKIVVLDGEWAECNALRYIISKKNGKHIVRNLTSYNNNIISTGIVINPLLTNRYNLPFMSIGSRDRAFKLLDLYHHPVCIHIPIEEKLLDRKLVNSITWQDILSDISPDYIIYQEGEMTIKKVSLSISYDAFGNVFLTAIGTYGKKIVQI